MKLKYAAQYEAAYYSDDDKVDAMNKMADRVSENSIHPPPWRFAGRQGTGSGDFRPMIPREDTGQPLPDYETWLKQQRLNQGSGQNQSGNADNSRHTNAVESNTTALQSLNGILRQGNSGGGDRTNGAIPAAFIGAGWQIKQLEKQAHALGAFGL